MTWVDWAIVIIMVMAVLGGLSEGFFRSACSLGGLLLGLSIAAWNYGHAAALLMPLVRIRQVADAVGFVLIALLVMALAAILGSALAKAFRLIGLGWLDGIAGAVFGFVQGMFLVTLGILVIVAFFPPAHMLEEARLPRLFFGACHLSAHMSPADLARRVREGLRTLEQETPGWMHPPGGKS
ncbi:MAG: CvpA family protein [Terracidiphilus sp.]|jgi:membrane protein required for colicin V production